jgi:hypothetical protein
MKRRAKYLLFFPLGLAVVFAGVVVFVGTPRGSNFVLSQLVRGGLSLGYRVSYDTGRFLPFSRITFQNLKIRKSSPEANEEILVEIKKLDFDYSLLWFSRTVHIRRAVLAQGLVKVRRTNFTKLNEQPAEKSRFDWLDKLKKNLVAPSVRIKLENIQFDQMTFQFESPVPREGYELSVNLDHFSLAAELTENLLKLNSEFEISKKTSVASWARCAPGKESFAFAATPYGKGMLAVNLSRDGEKWIYEMPESHFQLGAGTLSLREHSPGVESNLEVADLNVSATLVMLAKSFGLFGFESNPFEKLSAASTVTSGRGSYSEIIDGKKSEYSLGSQVFKAELSRPKENEKEKAIVLETNYNINNFFSNFLLTRPMPLHWVSRTQMPSDFKNFTWFNQLSLSGKPLFRWDVMGRRLHQSQIGAVDGQLTSFNNVPGLKIPAAVRKLGAIHAEFGIQREISTGSKGGFHVLISSQNPAIVRPAFSPISWHGQFGKERGNFGFSSKIKTRLNGIGHAPPELEITVDGVKAPQWTLRSEITLVDRPVANWKIVLSGEPGRRLKGNSNFSLNAGVVATYFLPKKLREGVSSSIIENQSDFDIVFPKDHPGRFLRTGVFKTNGTTRISQILRSGNILFPEPVTFNHAVNLAGGAAGFNVRANIAKIIVLPDLSISSTEVSATFNSSRLAEFAEGVFSLDLSQQKIQKGNQEFKGGNAHLVAKLQGGQVVVDNFTADFDQSAVRLTGEASARLASSEFLARGKLSAQIPDTFPKLNGQTFRGKLEIPWTVAIRPGPEITVDCDIKVHNLAWTKGDYNVAGISGHVPISERLHWDGHHLHFSELINRNAFERVDFDRLRPLIHDSGFLRIEHLGVLEKNYGPMSGMFSVRQNMILAHQFDLKMGRTGLLDGEMYGDINPNNLSVGILSRLTRLDLSDILPKKYLIKMPVGDQLLSGRTGVVINLNRSSVDGRIDITQIGGSQLVTLLNALDPKFENEKMNKTRTALNFGAPTFVQMSFEQGFMDIGMELAVLGISQRYDVRSIPLSSMVAGAGQEIIKKTPEGSRL